MAVEIRRIPTVNVTILSGNNINYARSNWHGADDGADSTALLDGFTIQGGSANISPNNSGQVFTYLTEVHTYRT